ncbi:MAG: hypothetical protein A3D64_00190 [Candidatus Wildermuthbacteria bacterium RIFCSPHIGHO2_02_FULL_49_9]|uniref:Uncharacterized protein n=2 Tax=Candidatus Wildermuthiibacteriota TaxID=1817923 RepID=A0A1G2QXU0_9BACT|nr:MAG: hypothetical protein A2672_02210 [Candidatus Wildermuthbacteria bacterium RIFCSPHIGHO2_01_FULL_49_22b]OHA71170.1 MAG: hypothetical protein A3D64_00190 [Candidatus Wildermuthbacteria bacterium RIFCSPHIGHO2_02_FULL_49_9]
MKKKEVTIEDLARMVQKGFTGVEGRIDKVDTRLARIGGRLESMEKRLVRIEQIFISDHH